MLNIRVLVRRIVLAAAMALAATTVTACNTVYPEYLAALREDPMASVALEGAATGDRSEHEASIGGLMGKPSHARIQIAYGLERDADPQRVKDRAIDAAATAGWAIDDADAEVVRGTKTLAGGDAEIAIYFVEPARLIIRLEHESDPPG